MSDDSTHEPRDPRDEPSVELPATTDATEPTVQPPEKAPAWSPNNTWTTAHRAAQDEAALIPRDEVLPESVEQDAALEVAQPEGDSPVMSPLVPPAGLIDVEFPPIDLPEPEGPTRGYLGLTAVIFISLGVVLIGAIIWLVFLFNNAPLTLPNLGGSPGATASPTAVPVPDSAEKRPVSEGCGALCTAVASAAGEKVIGVDDGMEWLLVVPWEDSPALWGAATEATTAVYASDAGAIAFTALGFADDAATESAAAELVQQRGEPSSEGPVYTDGTGRFYAFTDGVENSVIWHITGDESRPWLLQVQGGDDDALAQFFLSLSI